MVYKPKERIMKIAIKEAIYGNKKFEKYPMGAVVVRGNKIIAKSYNGLPDSDNPIAHAEILAIQKAAKKLGTRDLTGCVLYSTNEPCAMCSGAIVWANMDGLVFGANVNDLKNFWKPRRNEKTSKRRFIFLQSYKILNDAKPKIFIIKNFLRKKCLPLFELYNFSLKR